MCRPIVFLVALATLVAAAPAQREVTYGNFTALGSVFSVEVIDGRACLLVIGGYWPNKVVRLDNHGLPRIQCRPVQVAALDLNPCAIGAQLDFVDVMTEWAIEPPNGPFIMTHPVIVQRTHFWGWWHDSEDRMEPGGLLLGYDWVDGLGWQSRCHARHGPELAAVWIELELM